MERKVTNPNSLIFGTPGYGKAFAVKQEFLIPRDKENIIIFDPDAEYSSIMDMLNGHDIDWLTQFQKPPSQKSERRAER